MDIKNSTGRTTKQIFKSIWRVLRPTPSKVAYTFWAIFLLGFGFIYFFASGAVYNTGGLFGELPSFEVLENPSNELASEIYSDDGALLGKKFRSNRTPVAYDELSQNMIDALLATEDVRYFEHSGIDLKGTFAILYYLAKGDKRGSSTISQQLAKNLYKTRTSKYEGSWAKISGIGKAIVKIKEWVTAARLERAYTKEEIMSMYLNTVDFGSNSFGIKVASTTFFGKDQKDLDIEEAAMLAGLLKAPTQYSPILNPENALSRRNTILGQLNKYQYITKTQHDSLVQHPIRLDYKVENHNTGHATYFRKVASNWLASWCEQNGYDLYADGLKIYTTINLTMQKYAEESVKEHMDTLQRLFFDHWKGQNPWSVESKWGGFKEMKGFLETEIKKTYTYRILKAKYDGNADSISAALHVKKPMRIYTLEGEKDTLFSSYDSLGYYYHFLHTGFVSIDPHSGEIKAWVGGINHKYFKYDHVKQGKRQPGSTFKPIVYTTILGETGTVYSPCYKVVDAPVTFITGNENKPTWTPQNADGEYSGDTLTLRQAMARSVNSVTAYMMKLMGDQTPYKVKDYAERLGIESYLEPVPAMCLGTFDVSLFEMVGAYGTFANKGFYTRPYFIKRIEDRFGNVIADFTPERRKVLSEELAYVMLHMLMGATQEKGGTGRGLYRYGVLDGENEIGAKTGTTQNHSDGWFMGVTKDLVSGCWVGGEHRAIHFRTLEYGQGAKMALPIWGNYMKKVYADSTLEYTKGPFEKPDIDFSIQLDCGTTLETDSLTLEGKEPEPLDKFMLDLGEEEILE